jgi:predicted transcriptional regulator
MIEAQIEKHHAYKKMYIPKKMTPNWLHPYLITCLGGDCLRMRVLRRAAAQLRVAPPAPAVCTKIFWGWHLHDEIDGIGHFDANIAW